MNALAKLGDPVGRVYDGVLETQKEWAAGNLKLFDEVCDIHLNCDGYKGMVHRKKMVKVVEPLILGQIEIFA